MTLTAAEQSFILHFGEMGSRWGINRTVGQIYALLYLSENPLNAEEISTALGFSRSNISMGLKELDSWRLVQHQHLPNDRRDYFSTPEDIWEILRILAEERRKREVEPTLSMLRDVLITPPKGEKIDYAHQRMQEMYDLIEMLTNWHTDIKQIETTRLIQLLKLGAKIYKLYEMADNLPRFRGKSADKTTPALLNNDKNDKN